MPSLSIYGDQGGKTAARKYSPSECTDIKKYVVEDNPDKALVSTSYVEPQNLAMRMHMRRFTRLTNAFFKAVALHFMYYNFVGIHQTLKLTPAMESGLTDRL